MTTKTDMHDLSSKRILVTGACGTVGSEVVSQLLSQFNAAELIAVDNNESELFFLEQRHSDYSNARFALADIRDECRMSNLMRDVDLVFHTAAFKHVILCERSPSQAVANNILGVQSVIQAARNQCVEKVIFTSSDKAVNPTSVMGTSKLMGERLITAANSSSRNGDPIFFSTRFGNVLGSRGSVIPIFKKQISKGGPVTLTHKAMTRFVMSISQAVKLVIGSERIACGGEVFITKMPVIKIADLAEVMIEELAPAYGYDPADVKIVDIGIKPGEKLYEELMSEEECSRSQGLKRYFAIEPAFRALYRNITYEYEEKQAGQVKVPYNSQNATPLEKQELKKFLFEHDLLAGDTCFEPAERFWPDPDDKQ